MKALLRLLLLLIALQPHKVFCQTQTIDNLKQKISSSTADNDKLLAITALCEEYQTLPKDTLWAYALMAQQLALKHKDAIGYSLGVAAQANAYIRWGNLDSALTLINAELVKNPVTIPGKRKVHFKLAAQRVDCFGDASNYKDALAELYRIINDAEQYKDPLALARNMNTIGVINYNLDRVPEAFSWYHKALSSTRNSPEFYAIIGALSVNLAETHRWVDQLDSAVYYADKAISYCTRSDNLYFLANAYRVRASIYKNQQQYDKAEKMMLDCMAIREKSEGKLHRSNEQIALAGIYLHAKQTDKAIKVITDALALGNTASSPHEKAGDNSADALKISYYTTLARCYEIKGDHKNYEATLLKLIAAKDSFYQVNSANAIAELQTRYEVQKQDATIARQKLDIIVKDYLLYGTIVLIVFAALMAFILFGNYRKKQRYKMEQILQEEKLAAEKAVARAEEKERVRIAADLHDNLGAYAASISANLDHITIDHTDAANKTALQELRNNSQAIVSQLSDTIWVLKKDTLSLTAISDRLKVFIQRIQSSYPGILIDVEEDIDTDHLLISFQAFHLFKILQEAITNALKHSGGNHISIRFDAGKSWKVCVMDNGKGFKEQVTGGNGLRSMKDRASEAGWHIEWTGEQPSGTAVCIIPATTN